MAVIQVYTGLKMISICLQQNL